MTEARRGAVRRWTIVGVAVALLLSLPTVVGALPAPDRGGIAATDLLARVRSSAGVAHVGLAESHGRLALPDVPQVGDLVDLVGGTTRARVWWGGPERWRVDQIEIAGETGTYYDGIGTWVWDSPERRVVRVTGEPAARLPRTTDLLPPELARRLTSAATDDEVTRIVARRVSGRTALGLRIRPNDPDTTLGRIDIWVDPGTGLPLRVELTGNGADEPTLVTSFLDLRYADPSEDRTSFVPPPDAAFSISDAPDIAALVDRFSPYDLPDRLVGLARRDRVSGLRSGGGDGGGVATYGDGYTLLVVVPLPRDAAQPILRGLERPPAMPVEVPGATAVAVSTPLVNGLVATVNRRTYVLAGTVTQPVLQRAAAALVADPPPRR